MGETRKQELADFFVQYGIPLPANRDAQEAIRYFVLQGSGFSGETPGERVALLKEATERWVGKWTRHKKESPHSARRFFVASLLPKTRMEIEKQIRDRVQGYENLDVIGSISPFKVCVKTSPSGIQAHVMFLDMLVLADEAIVAS